MLSCSSALQLTLGLGLQTYGKTEGGFHLMVSAIDVGQYVGLNDTGNQTFEVGAVAGIYVPLLDIN